jgi:hypothetical protein
MDSITKQLKSIIKEAILTEMFIKNFDELHREIDNKANQMDDVQKQQLLTSLSIAISEFDRKNNLLGV